MDATLTQNSPTPDQTGEREFDGFKKSGNDNAMEQQLQEHCRRCGIDPVTAVKLFPVLAR